MGVTRAGFSSGPQILYCVYKKLDYYLEDRSILSSSFYYKRCLPSLRFIFKKNEKMFNSGKCSALWQAKALHSLESRKGPISYLCAHRVCVIQCELLH